MKRLLHHLRKDALHQRWLLLAWILLLAGDLAIELAGLRSAPGEPQRLAVARPIVLLAFAFLHACFIVFADAPRDERQAWLTRPLGGGVIAGSKILLIAVAHLVVPLFFDAAKLIAAGAADAIVPAGAELSLYRGAGLGLFAGLAAVARRPAGVLAAVVGLWAVSVAAVVAVMVLSPFEHASSAPYQMGVNVAVADAIMLVGGFAAVWIAHVRRHSPVATAVVTAAALAAILVITVQPVREPLVGASRALDPALVAASIGPASFHTGEGDGPLPGTQRMTVFAEIDVDVRSDRYAALPVRIDAAVEGPRGRFAGALAVFVSPFLPRMMPDVFRSVVGVDRIVRAAPGQATVGFPILAGNAARIRRAFEGPSRLDWSMKLAVLDLEPAASLPLRPGASWEDKGDAAEIINIRTESPRGTTIHLRERVRSLLFDTDNPTRHTAESSFHYLLVNEARREAIALARGGNLSLEGSALAPIRDRFVRLDADLRALDPAIPADEAAAWLDGAVLRIVRVRLDGFIEKSGSLAGLDAGSLQ